MHQSSDKDLLFLQSKHGKERMLFHRTKRTGTMESKEQVKEHVLVETHLFSPYTVQCRILQVVHGILVQ